MLPEHLQSFVEFKHVTLPKIAQDKTDDMVNQFLSLVPERDLSSKLEARVRGNVEEYYQAFKRASLGAIVNYGLKTGAVTLIKIDTRYTPQGKLAQNVRQAVANGRFTLDALRADEKGQTFGFKVANEFSDHLTANKVIVGVVDATNNVLKSQNLSRVFVVRGPPDTMYLAVVNQQSLAEAQVAQLIDALSEKINRTIPIEARVQLRANMVSSDANNMMDAETLITTVDQVSRIKNSLPALTTQQKNSVVSYSYKPELIKNFNSENRKLRDAERDKFRDILKEEFIIPESIKTLGIKNTRDLGLAALQAVTLAHMLKTVVKPQDLVDPIAYNDVVNNVEAKIKMTPVISVNELTSMLQLRADKADHVLYRAVEFVSLQTLHNADRAVINSLVKKEDLSKNAIVDQAVLSIQSFGKQLQAPGYLLQVKEIMPLTQIGYQRFIQRTIGLAQREPSLLTTSVLQPSSVSSSPIGALTAITSSPVNQFI
jgi:hypothetical protein